MNTVLVVDDDLVFSKLLRTVLELEGYRVVVVTRQDDVVPAVRRERPALLLMDVHVSRGDTLGVLRELRADEALKTTSVVMTSGMDRSDECMLAGADAFLFKPFRPAEALTLVADLINRQDVEV
ncbi:MAG: response regulator [Chloroflexota bacterium]|nr:response regulator [Chloroflexota bacterium]